jgi:tRNA pseudouridine55 synthase
MIDGILAIDKEVGITSYDVIRRLKKMLRNKEKIGHVGTLDPFASGLLIILFGKATKLMNMFHSYKKVYEVEFDLGYATDTQDILGKVIQRKSQMRRPTIKEMERIIEEKFLGQISQIPPKYSAKRIKGNRAYKLARLGKDFELKPRNIFVSQFEISSYLYPKVKCKVECSTGTYIRRLVDDFGKALGTYATCKNLKRISIGSFNIKKAVGSKNLNCQNREYILEKVINL